MRGLVIFACVLGFPVLEAWLLFALSARFGWWVAGWLVVAALVGLALIRIERFAWSLRLAGSLSGNRSPLRALLTSARSFVAGALFIFPGVVSDVLALLVLVWPLPGGGGGTTAHDSGAIEGEYRRERAPQLPRKP